MNPRLIMLGLGIALGYVLGTRDGRERYDAMKAKVTELWEDPRVAKARKDVEEYARTQAPIIRERAEAAAKAAPGVAKDVADKVGATAKDVAGQVSTTAKDVAGKATATAKDVAEKATATAKDVADRAKDVAADLRERGENLVDSAVSTAGQARDAALDVLDDEDDAKA
jgi:gas vesicle protein